MDLIFKFSLLDVANIVLISKGPVSVHKPSALTRDTTKQLGPFSSIEISEHKRGPSSGTLIAIAACYHGEETLLCWAFKPWRRIPRLHFWNSDFSGVLNVGLASWCSMLLISRHRRCVRQRGHGGWHCGLFKIHTHWGKKGRKHLNGPGREDWKMDQCVKYLLHKYKDLSSNPSPCVKRWM